MDWTEIKYYAGIITVVCGAIAAVIGAWKLWLGPLLKDKVTPYLEGLLALAMLPHALEDVSKIGGMQTQLNNILREVRPNGGSSLRDAVNGIASQVAILSGTMRARVDNDPDTGFFESSNEGFNIWVSKTYCRWLECTESELLGMGFLTFVVEDEREEVREEWKAARQEVRTYHQKVQMRSNSGRRIFVEVFAKPVPSDVAVPLRWVGTLHRLDTPNP